MLPIVAWRNIWRSRTRSLVVIGSIVIGVWALVFLLGFFRGQVNNYINNIIENETSHIQFHDSLFTEDYDVRLFIAQSENILSELQERPEIGSATSRVIVNGMLSSSNAAQGVMVKGVHPDQEQMTTGLYDKIIEGTPFDSTRRNQIIISQRIAEKLKVKIRSKVVVTFQNTDGDISAAAFRIVGIYKTHNRMNDELYVFTHIDDMRRLTLLPDDAAHEIALVVNEFDSTDVFASRLSGEYAPILVQTYKQISPDLELFNSQIRVNMIIMTTIFMLALIFGIINTMLMAVLERMKELGMLMAIGMNKLRVFFMVVYETLFVSLLGAPIGMGLGYLTLKYLHYRGIDLSAWSRALEEFGMADIVRPVLDSESYVMIATAIVITAVLASIYPALRAIRLKPVEALRKI